MAKKAKKSVKQRRKKPRKLLKKSKPKKPRKRCETNINFVLVLGDLGMMRQEYQNLHKQWTEEDRLEHEAQEKIILELQAALRENREALARLDGENDTLRKQVDDDDKEDTEEAQLRDERAANRKKLRAHRMAILAEAKKDAEETKALIAKIKAKPEFNRATPAADAQA